MKRAAFAALALLGSVDTAHAWCRTTTDQTTPAGPTDCVTSGTPLAWARRCQTFSLDTRAGGGLDLPTIRTAIAASFDTWNAIDCGLGPVFSVVEGGSVLCAEAEYRSDDGNSNTVAFSNEFAENMYPLDAIAVTIVWHNSETGQIYDADMIINEAMGPFLTCPSTGCAQGLFGFDLRNVITHEAGHFLGLAHSADTQATMFYRADPGEVLKRTLAQDDLDGICDAYGDATLPSECDSTPRHGFDANCEREPSGRDGCGCDTAGRSGGDAPRPVGLVGAALVVAFGLVRRAAALSRRSRAR